MRCSQKVKIELFAGNKKLFDHYSEAVKFLKTYMFIHICEFIDVKFYDFCNFQKYKIFYSIVNLIFFFIKNLFKNDCLLYLRENTFLPLNNTKFSE